MEKDRDPHLQYFVALACMSKHVELNLKNGEGVGEAAGMA
jgi:hypothetical protein